ncbi:protein of unknown function [Azospirillum baldaniorum]|uniref:Uncharacterized protein n=1 Tax=Azospirillum baldaniorum TaxID=1064539 RepID=A0A9P1JN08_9PROT|nr:protein of unknown function [Azospirillum baldaniorum]
MPEASACRRQRWPEASARGPPGHPLPALGGPKVRLSRQRKRSLRVSGGERAMKDAFARFGHVPGSRVNLL